MRLGPRDRLGRTARTISGLETEEASDLADDQLGDERLLTVASAPKLDDVLGAVIGLDERRKRASLVQGVTYRVTSTASEHAPECAKVAPNGRREGRQARG